jgi:hypothetical protein
MNFNNPFNLLDEDNDSDDSNDSNDGNDSNDNIIKEKQKILLKVNDDKISDRYNNNKSYSNKLLTTEKIYNNKKTDYTKPYNKFERPRERIVSNVEKFNNNTLKYNNTDKFNTDKINTDKFNTDKFNTDKFNTDKFNNNEFVQVSSSKTKYKGEDNIVIMNKFEQENILDNLPFNYKMYVLSIFDKAWNDILSFNNIFTLKKWIDIPEVINSLIFKKDKITEFNISFMKNNISPIWEDNENRYGSRTNIQIYDLQESFELLKMFLINIANKTLLNKNINNKFLVNGIAFYPKKDLTNNKPYQIIQIWYNLDITKSFKIFNENIENLLKSKNYSVRTRLHTPQF